MRRVSVGLVSAIAVLALAIVGVAGATAADQKAKPDVPTAFAEPPPVGTKALCPVSGEEFTVTKATQRSEYKGKHYVFCCSGCKPKFDANPEKYVGGAETSKSERGPHGEQPQAHGGR